MFVVSEGVGYVPVPGAGEGFSAIMGLLSDPDLSARASVGNFRPSDFRISAAAALAGFDASCSKNKWVTRKAES
jgi:hypothetical protein